MPELTSEQRAKRKERLMLKSSVARMVDLVAAACDELCAKEGITRNEAFHRIFAKDVDDIDDEDDGPRYDLGHSYKD